MEQFMNVPDSMEVTSHIQFEGEQRSLTATLFGTPIKGQDGTIKLSTGQFGTYHHIDDIMSGLHFEQIIVNFGEGQTYILFWNNDDNIWSCRKTGIRTTGSTWHETLAQAVWTNQAKEEHSNVIQFQRS